VGGFLTSVVLPLAERYGVAVLLIDHKTKGDTGRYSRGASIKLQLTAVQLAVVATEPFSKNQNGAMTVECNKNRFGDYAEGDRWKVEVLTGNGKIALALDEFTKAEEHAAFITAADTQAVARAFRDAYPRHLPVRTLEVPGVKRDVARTIASQLRIRGVLEYVKGDSGPTRWKSDQTVLEFPEEAPAEVAS